MNKAKGKLMMALFFLTFFTVLTAIALTYSIKASRLPLLISIPGIGLSIAQVWREARSLRTPTTNGEEKQEDEESPEKSKNSAPLLLMLGWMVFLVLMIWLVGFLVTIPFYTLLFMKWRKESWFLSLLFAVAGFAILYFLFVVGLNMELYPGVVYEWWNMHMS
jgi:hypothetical protein